MRWNKPSIRITPCRFAQAPSQKPSMRTSRRSACADRSDGLAGEQSVSSARRRCRARRSPRARRSADWINGKRTPSLGSGRARHRNRRPSPHHLVRAERLQLGDMLGAPDDVDRAEPRAFAETGRSFARLNWRPRSGGASRRAGCAIYIWSSPVPSRGSRRNRRPAHRSSCPERDGMPCGTTTYSAHAPARSVMTATRRPRRHQPSSPPPSAHDADAFKTGVAGTHRAAACSSGT